MRAGAALLGRKGCVVLQGRAAELFEEPQRGLPWWQGASLWQIDPGGLIARAQAGEHPLDSSCQSTNLSMCHLYEAVNSPTV